jgi:indole-3-acetate monooxygenase
VTTARAADQGALGQPFPSDRLAKRRTLLDAVAGIREVLAVNAEESEKLRTLAPASVAALADTGLFRLKLPTQLGGAEADPVTQIEVIEATARIDSSAGWGLFIGAGALSLSAFLPERGIAKMFPGGRVPKASGLLSPGRARAVDGGYRVRGRWSWGSGIRHAEWVGVHALIENDAGAPVASRFAMLPAADVGVIDNWHVAGLKGTGSCDFTIDEVFVPEELTFDLLAMEPKRGGPLYRMGFPGLLVNELAGFVLGVGRRALDEIVAQATAKERGYGKKGRVADRAVFQHAIGESDLRLRAARALVLEVFERAWLTVEAGGRPDAADQVEMRAATVLVTEAALAAAETAFRYAGGTALRLENVLQRCLRDLHGASTHLMASDWAYEQHGRALLGFPDVDPMG